jgi:hypothetical protein
MKKFMVLMILPCLMLIACGTSVQPSDPVSVIRAEINSINKAQVDVATNLFSDDGQFVTGFGQPKGKDRIKNYIFGGLVKLKSHADIIELTANGFEVSGTIKLTNVALIDMYKGKQIPLFSVKATVQNGKIQYMEWGTASK